MTARKTIRARTPAELILKIRKVEGWPRVAFDTLRVIRRMKELYEITTTRDGRWYVANPRTSNLGA